MRNEPSSEPSTNAKPSRIKLRWGLDPSQRDAHVAWGARAMIDRIEAASAKGKRKPAAAAPGYKVGLLPDRQDTQTNPNLSPSTDAALALRAALGRMVDAHAIPTVNRWLTDTGAERQSPMTLDVVTQGRVRVDLAYLGFHVDLSVGGPGDYAYIGAWIAGDDPDWQKARWSGAAKGLPEVPEVGSRVNVTMNGYGPGVVLRRVVEGRSASGPEGFCGVIVLLDRDSETRSAAQGPCVPICAFGMELGPLPPAETGSDPGPGPGANSAPRFVPYETPGAARDTQVYVVVALRRGFVLLGRNYNVLRLLDSSDATKAEITGLLSGPDVVVTSAWNDWKWNGHADVPAIWLAHRASVKGTSDEDGVPWGDIPGVFQPMLVGSR